MNGTYEILEVSWIDSAGHGGWHSSSAQDYRPMDCSTVGYLIEDREDCVVLALNIAADAEHDVGEVICIPAVNVTGRRKLGVEVRGEQQ